MSRLLTRTLTSFIQADLKEKMVFLGGPRQVGKTTLAQSLLENFGEDHLASLNWDRLDHQERVLGREWPKSEWLIVLDEIHKFRNWRNLVKGFYDTLKKTHAFLIAGSARLDTDRKGGDSLLGRYHYYRLHPYSLPEVGISTENLNGLLKFGGFPEPFHKRDETSLRRWHRQRVDRLVKEDLRDLENIKDLQKVVQLAEELPNRVGSPLSFRNLALDLEVDPKTCKKWVEILDSIY